MSNRWFPRLTGSSNTWALRESDAAGELDISGTITASVGQSLAFFYEVYGSVGADFTATYQVRTSVGSELQFGYAINAAQIGDAQVFTYQVDSTGAEVGGTFTAFYVISAGVGGWYSATWNIRRAVGSARMRTEQSSVTMLAEQQGIALRTGQKRVVLARAA